MTYSDAIYGVWTDDPTPVFIPPPFDPLNYSTEAENGYLTQASGWATTFRSIALPNSYTAKPAVRTALGAGPYISGRRFDISSGLCQFDNQDPATGPKQSAATSNLNGRAARRALPAGAPRALYFAIDHNWNYKMAGVTTISIAAWYYDFGFNGTTDTLSLIYDGQSGATTHATTFVLGNSGAWKEAVWTIADAYLGGRLLTINGSVIGDFAFESPDIADLWFSEVVVTQAASTDTTYFYLVGPNNPSNIQGQLNPDLLTDGISDGHGDISAIGSYNNGPLP